MVLVIMYFFQEKKCTSYTKREVECIIKKYKNEVKDNFISILE